MSIPTINGQRSNGAFTLKGLNTNTIYGNYLQTSINKVIDINSLSSINELESIKTRLSTVETELSNLTFDVQTSLISPLYQTPSEINNMTALTSYISTQSSTIIENVVPKIRKFEGIVDFEPPVNFNVDFAYDMRIREMVYNFVNNNVKQSMLNSVVCRIYFKRDSTLSNSPKFDLALNFSYEFQNEATLTSLRKIYFPHKIYNVKEKIWYTFDKNRANIRTCDFGSEDVFRQIDIHFKRIVIGYPDSNKVFYKVFTNWTIPNIRLFIHNISIIDPRTASYTELTDNFMWKEIFIRWSPTILKLCDLYSVRIYLIPFQGEYIDFDMCTTSYIPTHKSNVTINNMVNNPTHKKVGTSTNWYNSLTIESNDTSFTLLMENDSD